MVRPVPNRFNPDALARDGIRYRAQVPLAEFTRLVPLLRTEKDSRAESGSDTSPGELLAEFTFSRRQKHIAVVGRLRTELPLVCQRCLSAMNLPIDESFELVFVDDEAAGRALPDELDPVVLDDNGQISVVELLEDEVLLHVPTVPRHADDAQCDPAGLEKWQALQPAATEPAARRNPFEVLKDLDL